MYVLVLVGAPGAGKTTISRRLASVGWRHINQDELGDRRACENPVRVALLAGQHVVVDRCNMDPSQRAHWVQLTRECGAFGTSLVALQLLLPLELCKQRARDRVGHPTLGPHNCDEVIDRFASGFVEATSCEGFGRVVTVRTSEEAVRAVEQLLGDVGQAATAALPLLPLPPPLAPPMPPPPSAALLSAAGSGIASRAWPPQHIHPDSHFQQQFSPYQQHQQQQQYSYMHGALGALDGGNYFGVQQQQPQQQWNGSLCGGSAAGSYCSGQGVQYGSCGPNGSYCHGNDAHQSEVTMSFVVAGAQEGGSSSNIGGQGPTHGSLGLIKRACRWENREGDPTWPTKAPGVVSETPAGSLDGQAEGTAGDPPSSCLLLPSSLAPPQQQQKQQQQADGVGVDLSHQQYDPSREQPSEEEQQQERQQHDHRYSYGSGGGGGGCYGRGGGGGYRRQGGMGRESQYHRDIVQRLRRSFADPSSTTPYDVPAEPGAESDPRVILLFDLNGTLTSHTSVRRAQGTTRLRPGTAHLMRLREWFRLGIYTSSTVRTVQATMEMLEEEAGGTLFDRRLVLHREHTAPAPAAHMDSGGNPWDTLKPLGRYFSRLDRVVLVDDDSYKSMADEEPNMLIVPCWREEDADCQVLRLLCEMLVAQVAPQGEKELPEEFDVRRWTATVSAQLHETAKAAARQLPYTFQGVPEAADESTLPPPPPTAEGLNGEGCRNGIGIGSRSNSGDSEAKDERGGVREVGKGCKGEHKDEGTDAEERSSKRHRGSADLARVHDPAEMQLQE